ncbi:MAG TPA: sugar ABC transporter substrate-binding protein [Candidatus Limnocylindrales bacterium]|nr:sugar ABC transporter substrate-binding protein [Candidatus Limnocylindrales bacterium]
MRITKMTASLAGVALVLAACGNQQASESTGDGGGASRDLRIVVVTHGQASDPFWSVVANGVDQAETDLGITVEYNAPETFDMVAMAELIDTAVASEPDGLVVSIPDATALGDSIGAAIEAGIPVVSINSGSDVYQDLGILTHVGQTEFEAGQGAGQRMAEAGVTNTVCVNQEVGNVALDLRCEGFADGLGGVPSEVVEVDLTDPAGAQAAVEAALSADSSIDGILTLGPTGADPTLAALEAAGLTETVQMGTFDLSESVLTALDAGQMLFAIDQQQYLQGYLGVLIVTQYAQYGLLPGGGAPVLTGPGFVTQENAAQVIELSAEGIR